MNFSETTALYMLIIANAELLATVAIAVVRIQRQMRRFERFWNSPTGALLANREPVREQPRAQSPESLESIHTRMVASSDSTLTRSSF